MATISLSLHFLLKGQLAFLNKYYEVVAVSGQDDYLEKVQQREGVRTVGVSIQRAISPIRDLISLVKLYLLFKKEKPLIVHSITPKAGLLSMTAAYCAGVPIRMHTFTGLIFPSKKGLKKQLLISLDRLLCHFATHVYPEGLGVKQDLIANKITTKPLTIIANGNINGIDVGYFSRKNFLVEQNSALKAALGIDPTDFVFIFVGRLVGDKGINELVQAFHQLSTNNSNVKMILVGTPEKQLDPLQPETLKILGPFGAKKTANSAIIQVGWQSDIRPYLAIADALVLPSYREGFPNVVLEAGAMGVPCIVTNINGSKEIVYDGANGLIIPIKDTTALHKAMLTMVTDTKRFAQMKNKSRQMVVSRYEQQMVWEAIVKEYEKVLLGDV